MAVLLIMVLNGLLIMLSQLFLDDPDCVLIDLIEQMLKLSFQFVLVLVIQRRGNVYRVRLNGLIWRRKKGSAHILGLGIQRD